MLSGLIDMAGQGNLDLREAVCRVDEARAINTLAVVLGKMPGFLDRRLSRKGPIPLPPADLAVAQPLRLNVTPHV